MIRRLLAASVVVPLVALSSFALAQAGGGTGWIDQPLASAVITSTPVAVTAHLAHPAGVTEARLVVNGTDVEEKPAGGKTLETVQFSWEPPGPGEYLLEVFGFGGGEWGIPGSVLVIVQLGEDASTTTDPATGTGPASTNSSSSTTTTRPTTTTTRPSTTTTTRPSTTTTVPTTTTTRPSTTTTVPTTTTTRPTTTTTTTAPCALGVPSPGGVTGTGTLTPTLSWSYNACQEPEEFEFQVSRSTDFARPEGGGTVGGFGRSAEVSVGSDCTTYYWRVRTYHLGAFGSWSSTGSFFIQTVRSCP